MELIVVALTHRKVSIKVREGFRILEGGLALHNQRIHQEKSILENVVLSTCNRVAIFGICDQIHTGKYYLRRYLANLYKISLEELDSYVEVYVGEDAMYHLFCLGAGLLSKVVGETQILGQLRHSLEVAHQAKTTGIMLNRLFKQMMMFAKEVHHKYKINERPTSVSYQGIQLLRQYHADKLENGNALIIGAGDMGQLAMQYILELPLGQIYWMNRSFSRLEENHSLYEKDERVRLLSLDELEDVLDKVDIIISGIEVESYLIRKEMIGSNRPRVWIDMGLPRNIHPHIGLLSNHQLYNIDDIYDRLLTNQKKRLDIAQVIEEKAKEEVEIYKRWVGGLGIHKSLEKLQEKTDKIYQDTLDSLCRKLPNLSQREEKIIAKHFKSIRNQLMKQPILVLKEMAQEENKEEKIALFEEIFGISEDKN